MIGRTIDHYQITHELGAGGMGVVYKAIDLSLDRTVALKFIPPESTRDPETRARFVHEAKAASALDHPNVCTVYEIGETEEGQMFLAMAFYQGETLKDRIGLGPLPLPAALDIAMQVGRGLEVAHAQGIAHRDIKPANIFVTDSGLVKILDFGLAKLAGQTRLTRTGTTLGTAWYFSPEQAQGTAADHRSDLWCLGVVLYEMVTGKVPFQGDYPQAVIYKIVNQEIEPPTSLRTGVPLELERIIRKCLAKRIDERYQNAADLIADLTHLRRDLEGDRSGTGNLASQVSTTDLSPPSGSQTRGVTETGEPRKKAPGRPLPRALLTVLFLVTCLAAALWLGEFRKPAGPIRTMAVLVRPEFSGSPERNYLCDLLAARLNATLSQLPQLEIQSQQAVKHQSEGSSGVVELGRKLKVDAVLTADMRETAGQLIVAVEVTDVNSGMYFWGKVFRRPLERSVEVHEEIAFDVAENLLLRLDASQKKRLSLYNKYLTATDCWGQRTEESLKRAIVLFEEIIAEDPQFARAHAGIASSYILLTYYGEIHPKVAFVKARAASEMAIQLDGSLAEAYAALGLVKKDFDRDWDGAIREFQKALQLDGRSVSSLQWYAELLTCLGRFDEAEKTILRALEADPTDLGAQAVRGWILLCSGRFEEAEAQLLATRTKNPKFHLPHWFLGDLYIAKGDYQAAITSLARAAELNKGKFRQKADLACAHALNGDKTRARELLSELRSAAESSGNLANYELAIVYAGLGENSRAIHELETALDQRSWQVTTLGIDPLLINLRGSVEFTELLRRAGLSVP